MADETKYVIFNIGLASGAPDDSIGLVLKSFDPEYLNGRGHAVWTKYIDDAMRFDTAADAQQFWRQQSKTAPVRLDGKPNRPLTAHTVNIVKVLK